MDKEEAILIANEFAKLTFIYGGKIAFTTEQMKKYQQATETVLKALDDLQKLNNKFMNAELFSAKQLKFVEEQNKKYFINKQVVKDKIEELKQEKVRYPYIKEHKIETLQELLEGK